MPPLGAPLSRTRPPRTLLVYSGDMRSVVPRLVSPLALCFGLAGPVGCDRGHHGGPPSLAEAPNLGGAVLGDDGEPRTPVELIGVMRVGETVQGALPRRGDLVGWEFEAYEGAELTVTLASSAHVRRARVSVYGPRSATGLWSDALTSRSGELPDQLTLDVAALAAPGMHLVLLQTPLDEDDAPYTLSLACRGNCGAPACPELEACERVCALGYRVDAEACRVCECRSAQACSEASPCPNGQTCGADGRCTDVVAPPDCDAQAEVCASDGQTWPNRCRAEQAGLQVVSEGPCDRPPPPECVCSDEVEPVCSVTHRTYVNACRLACAEGEDALAYMGRCLEMQSCRDDRGCPSGTRCTAVPEAANQARCAVDPRDPACERVCLPDANRRLCGGAFGPCAEGLVCYGESALPGLCVAPCGPDDAGVCAEPMECAVTASGGVCLERCDADQPMECPRGSVCRPDTEGVDFCQACDCLPPQPGEEVCSDRAVTFPSACIAACAQVASFRPGRCDDEQVCACPDSFAPVCVDGVVADRCEAACVNGGAAPEAPLGACLRRRDLVVACQVDADCIRTGCDGAFCLGADVGPDACAPLSPVAECYADAGTCGCVNNRCVFEATAETVECVDRLEPSRGDAPAPRRGR